jgi:hypothetical protein
MAVAAVSQPGFVRILSMAASYGARGGLNCQAGAGPRFKSRDWRPMDPAALGRVRRESAESAHQWQPYRGKSGQGAAG